MCIWAEHSALPAGARGRPGRPAKRPRPPRHPFATREPQLREALRALDVAGVVSGAAGAAPLTLRLPSFELGPQASPQLLRVADEAPAGPLRLRAWELDALALEPASAATLLLSLPPSPPSGIAYGDSLRFVAEAAKLALALVAAGRLRPALERSGEQWRARWLPVTDAPADAARLELLTRSLPPLLGAELTGDAGLGGQSDAGAGGEVREAAEIDPRWLVQGLLAAMVDVFARELNPHPSQTDSTPEQVALNAALPDAVASWLAALAAKDPVIAGDDRELAALAEGLEEWWAAAQRYAVQRMFRTCFRLVAPDDGQTEDEPAENEPAGDEPLLGDEPADDDDPLWRVEFLLQHKEDPSVLVPASEVWAHSDRLAALERVLENPQERLLGGLGHALALWPELAPALEEPAPTAISLSTEQAYQFLTEFVPLLEQAGFAVLAPPWGRQRLRAKLVVRPEDQQWEPSEMFGLSGLCAYEWQVAIGDQTLSLAELEALAALKLPVVKARGRWIALRADDVEMALRFFKRRQAQGRASVAELLREGLEVAPAAHEQPEVELEASGWLAALLSADRDRRLEPLPTPRQFVGDLRPYQQRGVSWLAFLSGLGLGACLADDMGLGKTVQLLALLLAERERSTHAPGPTLLICPVSVTGNWQREAERFAPALRVHVHHGRERLRDAALLSTASASDLVITTYALAVRDQQALGQVEWERVALDEAQNIKNHEAKQTRAIRRLRARQRVALTGTPVENRLSELHSIMDFLNPGMLGSAAGFQEQFATPIERWRDGRAAARLRRATEPFILRRLKTDREIIADLPEKIEMRVDCHLSQEQASLYQAVVTEMLERVEQVSGIARAGVILQALVKLKQVCNHPVHLLKDRSRFAGRSGKLARLEELLEEALAEGDKALCFTQFAEFGQQLRGHLQERLGAEVLFLHGGTPKAARDEMVARFQAPEGPSVFVLSLKAGGTGLNLTAANHVIHYDRWWNPAVEDQATDRAFRIGQRKNVQVHKLTCVGTLEERIDLLLADKRELAQQIVGGSEAWLTELNTGQLRELLSLSADAVLADAADVAAEDPAGATDADAAGATGADAAGAAGADEMELAA